MARTKGAKGLHARYNISYMVQAIRKYTDATPLPILKECCYQNHWNYNYFISLQSEHEVLRNAVVDLLTKKEIQLERFLMSGQNNTAAVFSLKQLGWKDEPNPIIVNNTIQNNQGGNRSEKLRKCDTKTLEQLEAIYNEMDADASEGKDAQKDT